MKKKEILKFYQTYKLYIFPAVVILSSLILIMFVIYPQINRLVSNQKTEGDILSKMTVLEIKAETLAAYDVTDLNLKVNYALNVYPTDKDFAIAISILQDLTGQLGFEIASLSLGSGTAKAVNSQNYTIKLELIGPVNMLPALLKNIEGSPRIMRVDNIEVNIARDQSSSSMSLTVNIFYGPLSTNYGNIDSSLPELSSKDQEILQKLARFGNANLIQSQATAQSGPRGKENPFE